MRGRPPKPGNKIDLTRTRSDNPSAAEAKEVATTLAAAVAVDADEPARDGKGRAPVGSARTGSPFIQALRHCRSTTRAELVLIEAAQAKGFNVADAAALWMFMFLRLQKDRDGLDGKTYAIGMNQLLTSATKLAEISARLGQPDVIPELRVVFDIVAAQKGREDSPPPGECGDKIEAE